MLLAEYAPPHTKHLPVDPLRLRVLPIASAGISQITRRGKPLFTLLRLIAHPRPPRLREPRSHRPREVLPARLALPPHRVASVPLLHHCFLDEAADVRQAGVGSARAARLNRRRVGIKANDTHAPVRLYVGGGHVGRKDSKHGETRAPMDQAGDEKR